MSDQPTAQANPPAIAEPSNAVRQPSGRFSDITSRAAWMLVACSPIIFALLTWPIFFFAAQDAVRHYSLPIVAIEMTTVVLALATGWQPSQSLAAAPPWCKAALAILGAVATGTALFVAPDQPAAVLRTLTSIFHVLFALSLVHLFAKAWRPLDTAIWPSIALGTLGYVVLLVPYVASITNPENFDWGYFMFGVTNVRQTGFYSVVGACVAFGLAISSNDKRTYSLWLVVASILLAESFWSGTRSSLIAFAAACIVGLRLFPSLRTLRAARSFMLSTVLGLMLSLLHQVPHPLFGALRLWIASGSADPGTGRLEIWRGTARMFLERPLFGFGESQFRLLLPEVEGAYNHPHNWVLQILFQWGLVGAVCYFSLAVFIWFRFEGAIRRMGSAALPAYLTATSLLIYSLYEGTMYHPYPIAMLAVAVAWAFAGTQGRGRHEHGRMVPSHF